MDTIARPSIAFIRNFETFFERGDVLSRMLTEEHAEPSPFDPDEDSLEVLGWQMGLGMLNGIHPTC